ncbi:MAG: polyprenyl synthetase family protein, partial [Peptococcaceae bacterium]|nr:polyprenyl synthetase family protein [Peptococcaceae bacterium]
HDDLPSMDDDDYRRGRPSNHKVYGEAVAILAGDALLTHAFFLLASINVNKPEERLRVIGEIANAAGSCGMIGGQVVDTCPEDGLDQWEALDYIHRHKTGALYRASVRIGAILAGAPEEVIERLTDYGDKLGLLFQIVDDILDVEGDANKLGKPVGSDAKNRKLTYPLLYGLEESKQKAVQVAEQAIAALSDFGSEAEFLRQLVNKMVVRDR